MKTIYMTGIVGLDITADKFRKDFHSETKEKRRVILNSVGGSVSEGFEIYNIMKAYRGEIELVFGSMVASIAAYFAMAVPKENRKAFKNSSMMVHEASAVMVGRARDFKTFYEQLEGVNNIMAEAISEGMSITREQARDIMSEDKFYTGWEALVDNGIISDVIEPKEIDIPKKEEDENGFLFLTGMMNELEKAQDMTVVKAKMYECEKKMNADIKKSQDDIYQAAALLKLNEINLAKKPDDNINPKKEVKKMKLKELLEANPEAKAEYDLDLESAKGEKGKADPAEMNAVIAEDRKRIASILTFSGVALTAEAEQAINSNMSDGDFAKAELVRQKGLEKAAAEKDSPFAALVSKQTLKEQTKNAQDADTDEARLKAFDENAKKAIQNVIPKKKEVK